ncbi:MAG: flavodoxin domain-containing protein [Clostridia bacterium]|nr:flavodoxin domain-containing protein [Clostridia bacterium]
MKILIAYATKTGTTKECAMLLADEFHQHEVEIIDLSLSSPCISKYDIAIVGGSIRMGKLDKRVYNFLQENKSTLDKTKTAYFICNGLNEDNNVREYFKKCFPSGLIESAVIYDSFGGEFKVEKQKGLDKFIVKMILKANEENDEFEKPNILTEAIGRFADKIKDYQ